VPIRGGNWNNAGNAGPGALNLNNARSNVNTNIGFFLALLHRQMLCGQGRLAGTGRKGGITPFRGYFYARMEKY